MSVILVIGMGKSGQWAARLALKQGYSVLVYDDRDIADSLAHDLRGRVDLLPPGTARSPVGVEQVILSPGVPPEHNLLQWVEAQGLPVISEIEFAFRAANGRVFAITGSNGKTTTTALTAHLLRAGGRNAVPCGNYGRPFAQAVLEEDAETDFVLELSSFQLERIDTFKPRFAAVLNLTPDHLDRYEAVSDYYAAKFNLFRNMDSADIAFVNGDDPETARWTGSFPEQTMTIGEGQGLVQIQEDGLTLDDERLVNLDELQLMGRHNLYNAAFAAAMVAAAGIERDAIRSGLCSFVPISHRLELVGERNGVRFFNDSKATNFDSVIKALNSFDAIRLIAGGKFKGGDFDALLDAGRERVRSAYLIGDSAGLFHDALAGSWSCTISGTLDQALLDAARDAVDGDVVLLAPGCASFDQFANYEERGDVFRRLVEALP